MYYHNLITWLVFMCIHYIQSEPQNGPDPWNYDTKISTDIESEFDVPPDLRIPVKRKNQVGNTYGNGELFFRRALALILKGGQVKKNDDGSRDVSLQMWFDSKHWETLEGYLQSNNAFSEDMLRRSLGYIEEAIYRPTVVDAIVMTWNEYIVMHLMEYKMHITWSLGIAAAVSTIFWLWNRMSHRHLITIICIMLYLYEVFISYKEAEQQELNTFISAMNKCKWYFWSSNCEVPPPDPLVFLKHMNPLKIGIRMFTSLISEPMITISATIERMIHGITDGLWFPFDRMVYGILIVFINLSLIFFLISVVFNYILNIPLNLNLGLMSIGLKQRKRTIFSNETNKNKTQVTDDQDRISGATLNKLLDVCSRALNVQSNDKNASTSTNVINAPKIRRCASTGRLPNLTSFDNTNLLALETQTRQRKKATLKQNGSGDAL